LHTNAKTAVIGLSGGLDSTLALLVTYEAFKMLNKNAAGITAVTMPCFGTTERTLQNAQKLAKALHITLREIPIAKSVEQHFADIGHDKSVTDVTYENSQARERTQVLMDIANQTGGLVIGTGDLSELALGWATYNGDHMSMYGVNASIPKTLVRYLVEWFAIEMGASPSRGGVVDSAHNADTGMPDASCEDLSKTLFDILATPVSPELLPPKDGHISQRTEDLVGPYELHDFFLYYMLRFGFSPQKILYLAENAFAKDTQYSKQTILHWMQIFYKRFFSQQFKRSCLPDGAKVGTVSISPRGDWRMPSDASAAIWLDLVGALL
jgi:NAD+ synthase (glutamine-hydrolysing)